MRPEHLPNWQPHEQIKLLLRRHPWIIIRHGLITLFIGLIPVAAYFLIRYTAPAILEDQTGLRWILIIVGTSLYALLTWLFFFTGWLDYYLDVWIVTTERIVSIEQRGLFARTIAEQRLSRVQDVSSVTQGKIATLLNYGDVRVQTAGTEERFVFEQVPNPERVCQQILEAHDAWVQAHPEAVRFADGKVALKGKG